MLKYRLDKTKKMDIKNKEVEYLIQRPGIIIFKVSPKIKNNFILLLKAISEGVNIKGVFGKLKEEKLFFIMKNKEEHNLFIRCMDLINKDPEFKWIIKKEKYI